MTKDLAARMILHNARHELVEERNEVSAHVPEFNPLPHNVAYCLLIDAERYLSGLKVYTIGLNSGRLQGDRQATRPYYPHKMEVQ